MRLKLSYQNVILTVIASLLLLLCFQNLAIGKVELYRDGRRVGAGLRGSRTNGLPVEVEMYDPIEVRVMNSDPIPVALE